MSRENRLDQVKRKLAIIAAIPGLLWLCIFMMLPLLAVCILSFMTRGSYGEVMLKPTISNYLRLIGFSELGFSPIYIKILLRTTIIATTATCLCIVLAIPLTLIIARLPKKYRGTALLLLIIPFWTNLLIRTYAWMILLSPDGLITYILRPILSIAPDEGLFPSQIAVIAALVCDYLPYLALPLYASVEKIDWGCVEAAYDLGAKPLSAFRYAIFPQIKPGLVAGAILVFVPALGQYIIPDLLGGSTSALLGNTLAQQFGASRDWPFGAAISCIQLFLALCLMLYFKTGRKNGLQFV